jgi:hypothetical protein
VLAIPAHAIAYRTPVRYEDEPRLAPSMLLQLVIVGFGALVPTGGFAMDKRALQLGDKPPDPTVRALGPGSVEWAVLAPVAWASAVGLLPAGDSRPMFSLLWPWASAAPIGFAIGLPLASPERIERICAGEGQRRP